MREQLMQALVASHSLTQVADAFDAAINAAHTNHPAHGYAAALEVLKASPAVSEVLDENEPVETETTE